MSDELNSNNSKGFFDRTFDNGPAAKRGCVGLTLALLFAVVGGLSFCSYKNSEERPVEADQNGVAETGETQPSLDTTGESYTSQQREMICKASIAALMGRDPKTMTARTSPGEIVRIQYRRSDDNKLWKSDCRLEGQRVIWRGVDSFGSDGPGRWRNEPEDEILTFKIVDHTVSISQRFSDGSETSEDFSF